MRTLAAFVDSLSSEEHAVVSETHVASVSINGLSRSHAKTLLELASEAGLSIEIHDALESRASTRQPLDGEEPFSATFLKPEIAGEAWFFSLPSFGVWLNSPTNVQVVRVASCQVGFTTEAFHVCPIDGSPERIEVNKRKSPRRIVKDGTSDRLVPLHLGPYLLASDSKLPRGDHAFEEWVNCAAKKVALALAQEVDQSFNLEFTGPPRASFSLNGNEADLELIDWFEPMQEAARWVYEIERDTETRHRLFAHEFARVASAKESLCQAALLANSALESARIAYSFHLHEITKDALKSLADLRKSVIDEVQKVFDTTRQLVLGVVGALFYAVGIIAARLSSSIDQRVFSALLIIGIFYVSATIVVNRRGLDQQRALRNTWRSKIYRYLTDDEFTELVQSPVSRAERVLLATMWIALLLVFIVFLTAVLASQ